MKYVRFETYTANECYEIQLAISCGNAELKTIILETSSVIINSVNVGND